MSKKVIGFLIIVSSLIISCSFQSPIISESSFIAKIYFDFETNKTKLIFINQKTGENSNPLIEENVYPGDMITNMFHKNNTISTKILYSDFLQVKKDGIPGAPNTEYTLYSSDFENYIVILNENCKFVVNKDKSFTDINCFSDGSTFYLIYREEEKEDVGSNTYRIFPYALYSYQFREFKQ